MSKPTDNTKKPGGNEPELPIELEDQLQDMLLFEAYIRIHEQGRLLTAQEVDILNSLESSEA